MYELGLQKEIGSVDADVSGAGDLMTFTPGMPVEIVEFGYIVKTAIVDAAGGLVMKADIRPTAESDTSRGDGDGGVMTLTSAQANQAAGKVVSSRPATAALVYPGQQVVLELTTAPDSGAAFPYIVFRPQPTADRTAQTVVIA